jgi:hypothetical protein
MESINSDDSTTNTNSSSCASTGASSGNTNKSNRNNMNRSDQINRNPQVYINENYRPRRGANRRSTSTAVYSTPNSALTQSVLIDQNNNNSNLNDRCVSSSLTRHPPPGHQKKPLYQHQNRKSPDFSINDEGIESFNRLNREVINNIDTRAWLSEKPLSILHLDVYDRAVLKIADQRDKIQKKTFTKWINKHLSKLDIEIADLFEDLRSGLNLIYLLEILSNAKIKKEKGDLKFHMLQNVQICLNFLTENNVSNFFLFLSIMNSNTVGKFSHSG